MFDSNEQLHGCNERLFGRRMASGARRPACSVLRLAGRLKRYSVEENRCSEREDRRLVRTISKTHERRHFNRKAFRRAAEKCRQDVRAPDKQKTGPTFAGPVFHLR